jgi:DNA polymerase
MPKAVTLPPWEKHVAAWQDCKRCHLHKTRDRVVLARGDMPCDILYVGEGPGHSEDGKGLPFVGAAGKVQDGIIADALAAANVPGLTWAFVNLLGCIPLDSQGIDKVDRPPDECVRACAPRLTECFALFKPKLVVCLGNDAADWLNGKRGHGGPVAPDVPRVKTVHPAAILRAGGGAVAYQLRRQSVATLATAIRTHCGPMTWRSDDANAPF